MINNLLLKGMIIGFSIAAPVGPIGILCINRTLANGLLAGVVSGLGAAIADALYGCIAGFGLVSLSQFLLGQKLLIHSVGGSFLMYLGLKTFFSQAQPKRMKDSAHTLWQDFTSTLFLTLTNPTTIISFLAIYASLGIVDIKAEYHEAILIVFGVFLGSLLWWLILTGLMSIFRHKLSAKTLHWINRVSGIVLFAFGLIALAAVIL